MPILIPKIKAFVKGKPPRFTIFYHRGHRENKKNTEHTEKKLYFFV